MRVSVITVCFNCEKTIHETLASVSSQSWPDIEHVVIDGASTDRTVDIVNQFDHVAKLISEPDNGIYDAMNKGIDACSGEVLLILNGDDSYAGRDVVQKYAEQFAASDCDSVYADLVYVDSDDTSKVTRRWVSGNYDRERFLQGWMPPHPTFAVRKAVYEKHGLFNVTLGTAADYELMLRFLFKYKISAEYIPETTVVMRNSGASNSSLLGRLRANTDDRHAWTINGLKPRFYTLYLKPISKFRQFFVR